MTEYIPFVSTPTDINIFNKFYVGSNIVRVPYENVYKIINSIPKSHLWLDPCVDGYHYRLSTNWPSGPQKEWGEYYKSLWSKLEKLFGEFSNYDFLTNQNNWQKNRQPDLDIFVAELLEKCISFEPEWLSVPQLPLTKSKKIDNVNKMLAEATNTWKRTTKWQGRLILPIIFTNQNQLSTPATRRDRIENIITCFERAGAKSVWVVDATLNDQQPKNNYPKRYDDLIDLHSTIRKRLGRDVHIIAGPYWGINLVLWAKDLCDCPAISLSGSYSYNFSCGVPSGSPVTRIVLPSLKRLVILSKKSLEEWIDNSLSRLSKQDTTYIEFNQIKRDLDKLAKKAKSEPLWIFAMGKPQKMIKKWSNKLILKDTFPIYLRTPINPNWEKKTKKLIKIVSFFKTSRIVHLRFL